ncbi:unnamed protein product, partial [Discosporangium mesarthrocarpum]
GCGSAQRRWDKVEVLEWASSLGPDALELVEDLWAALAHTMEQVRGMARSGAAAAPPTPAPASAVESPDSLEGGDKVKMGSTSRAGPQVSRGAAFGDGQEIEYDLPPTHPQPAVLTAFFDSVLAVVSAGGGGGQRP